MTTIGLTLSTLLGHKYVCLHYHVIIFRQTTTQPSSVIINIQVPKSQLIMQGWKIICHVKLSIAEITKSKVNMDKQPNMQKKQASNARP